jgi:hypothetical protein
LNSFSECLGYLANDLNATDKSLRLGLHVTNMLLTALFSVFGGIASSRLKNPRSFHSSDTAKLAS